MSERSYLWAPTVTLVKREIVRFFRQRSRVMAALGTPILFWGLIGSGLGHAFQSQGGYLEYFFPGTVTMVVLFTAIFSTISIIEDRREGFMQGVIVAPVSRLAIVGGKVIGGTILATIQGVLFLLVAPLVGFPIGVAGFALAVASIVLVSLALTSLSFIFAWKLNSVQGFHGVMNLILFPMWLLSGAAFPLNGAPVWLKAVMVVNPLTYGTALIRRALYLKVDFPIPDLPQVSPALVVTTLFAVVFYGLAAALVSRPAKESSV